MKEYSKRNTCAGCDNDNLSTIFNFGNISLLGQYPKRIRRDKEYELGLIQCKNCKLVQTNSIIDPDFLFKDYRYSSSVSLSDYFKGVAKLLTERHDLKNKKVLEFGCNDGVLMKPLSDLGVDITGVDPATNIVNIARGKGLNVINDYFNFNNFKNHENKYDVVIANNTFAHVVNLQDTLKTIKHVLKDGGLFIFEVHYLGNLISELQWDNIYHEHIYYYSIQSLRNLFKNMLIEKVESLDVHSGSVRVIVRNVNISNDDIVSELPSNIKSMELELMKDSIEKFSTKTQNHIISLKNLISSLKRGNKIVGYGASGRAAVMCNVMGWDSSDISYIIDESSERTNRYISNTDIKIVGRDKITDDIDIIVIFAWNYSKMIMEKLPRDKYLFLVLFPQIQMVRNFNDLIEIKSL
tara:strand:+ start:512 stop:1738 length:1227 start_codon:yes stop_codon:yes gene_type:complete